MAGMSGALPIALLQTTAPGAGDVPPHPFGDQSQWVRNLGEDLLRAIFAPGPIVEVRDLDAELRQRQDAARETQAARVLQEAGVQSFIAKKLVEVFAKTQVELTLGEAFGLATAMQVAGGELTNFGNVRGTIQVWVQLPATAGVPAQIDPLTLGTKSAPHTQYRLGYSPATNLLTIQDITTGKFVSGAKLGIRIIPAVPSIPPVMVLTTVGTRPSLGRLGAGNLGSALSATASIPYMLTTPKSADEYFLGLGLSMQAGGPVAGIGYTGTQMLKGLYARVTGQYGPAAASGEPDLDIELLITNIAGEPNNPVTSSHPHDGI